MKKSKLFFKAMLFAVVAMLIVSSASCGGDDEGLPSIPDTDDVCTAMDDSKFMEWCYKKYDVNGDGKVSKLEAAAVRELTPDYLNSFSSVKGIEYFTGVEKLDIYGSFSEIVLNRMSNLINLEVESNVKEFDLSNNSKLKRIWIQNRNYSKNMNLEDPTNIIIGFERLKDVDAYFFGIVKMDEIDLLSNQVQLPQVLIVRKLTIPESVLDLFPQKDVATISNEQYTHYYIKGEYGEQHLYFQELNVK